jgi:hypothetical protein
VDAAALQGTWLAWLDAANRQPITPDLTEDQLHAAGNAIKAGFVVTALLGELRALNPERADHLASDISVAIDRDDIGELLSAWRVLHAAGLPTRIYTQSEAVAALTRLATRDRATADFLNQRWTAITRELSATGVVASVVHREHELGPRPTA